MFRPPFLRHAKPRTVRCTASVLTLAFVTMTMQAQARRVPTAEDAYLSIKGLQRAYASRELTPLDMTLLFLDRIKTIDQAGPTLRSVTQADPGAADWAQKHGGRGRLGGIAILLKDNIDSGDRLLTTAGSLALASAPAARDAVLVRKLRSAGAVILGKANMTEWANFRAPRSEPPMDGWSARGGQTLNPYVLDAGICGSSSGSAVAVAAGLATASIGTETNGSILCPAAVMGLVGIKPTVGLVSRSGIVPAAPSQDTAGPLARSVADAAAVLSVIAGSDYKDGATAEADAHAVDYTQALDRDALRGKRIGVVPPHPQLQPMYRKALETAIAEFEAAGAIVVRENIALPDDEASGKDQDKLIQIEMKQHLPRYLTQRNLSASIGGRFRKIHTLKDIIDFNLDQPEEKVSVYGQDFLVASDALSVSTEEYVALRGRLASDARQALDGVLDGQSLDALVAAGAWGTSAMAGYPAITLPVTSSDGFPLGVMLYGRKWSEASLIGMAYALEERVDAFVRPQFLATSPSAPDGSIAPSDSGGREIHGTPVAE